MRILTVVGRASNRASFEKALNNAIYEPFKIAADIIPLDEDEEAKRFLAYIEAGENAMDDLSCENMKDHLQELLYAVEIYDSPSEALSAAENEYGADAYSSFMEPVSAMEIWRRDVLYGLIRINEIFMMRARLDKKPVIALVHIANGHGKNDTIVTPYALLLDEDLGRSLELPFRSSYDEEPQDEL